MENVGSLLLVLELQYVDDTFDYIFHDIVQAVSYIEIEPNHKTVILSGPFPGICLVSTNTTFK